jgi:hypothetical protein
MLSGSIGNRLRGKMQDIDEKQTCPFCEAEWGSCEHYRLLAEWENFASHVERKSKRAPQDAEREDAKDIRISN